MAKSGPKPKPAANPTWTSELAYACGLMATDGCVINDGRHMSLTSGITPRKTQQKLDRQWQADLLAKQKKQPVGFIKGGSILRIA